MIKIYTALVAALLFGTLTAAAQTEGVTPEVSDTDSVAQKIYEVRRARSGIIVVDSGAHTRAFEPFSGVATGGTEYAGMVNDFKAAFGSGVNVYCMIIPTAAAYYCPDEASAWTKPERPVMNSIFAHLTDSVVRVDVFDALASHVSEPVYSRTDHHWAPLGAYYAAREFARIANVPFRDLSSYEQRTVKDYVGSMYTFSKDVAVKNAPEEFVYYVPKDVDYTSLYTNYILGKNRRVIRASAPVKKEFFIHYSDGNRSAYCTFAGGDTRTVKVTTSTKNGRRLVILKDSYGNALPGYLFYGFEEIHLVDFRYFTENIVDYVADNNITDVLFANNLIHAYSPKTAARYRVLLSQRKRR